ncbi:hypothetical protein HETIRDRAFT_426985 [Heterobasidion irregulare TC 32-1]|uniref:Uncharacterized protein n=1 Tax=Heterobasidion irregulare (strain TC 32-1) TaxID=747525 RepID=W4K721_HETIT|nr:uncharacterized protein HETIRDRAFT_426985 [Heterobasidion irregulare TC 32-1]ETW81637.1 hypothetical protein HETIRDRAFT_426985 [Heterobasidion irregulare TC 32-1]
MFRTSTHASPSNIISRSLAAARVHRRFASQKPQGFRLEDYRFDPRPSWVYTLSTTLRLVLIPSALVYAVFFADFGEKEHVFMPPRRWLERQKAAFFTLSPAEQELTEKEVEADAGAKPALP